jgi:hypothetical protein
LTVVPEFFPAEGYDPLCYERWNMSGSESRADVLSYPRFLLPVGSSFREGEEEGEKVGVSGEKLLNHCRRALVNAGGDHASYERILIC